MQQMKYIEDKNLGFDKEQKDHHPSPQQSLHARFQR